MAVLKVLAYGNEILRTPSKEVHKISKKIHNLVQDMSDTMYAYNGVGLAAPQVGENLRIFVIDVSPENGPKDPIVFINPKIIKKSGAMISTEGCLSFPESYMDVRRYSSVTVKALGINNKPFVMKSTGNTILTKVLQHEFDHLDGILFIDHTRNRFEADMIL
ncbi:MAG: peptide deformylase, partial [Candidatus Gastranaerophilaceae bacterium]